MKTILVCIVALFLSVYGVGKETIRLLAPAYFSVRTSEQIDSVVTIEGERTSLYCSLSLDSGAHYYVSSTRHLVGESQQRYPLIRAEGVMCDSVYTAPCAMKLCYALHFKALPLDIQCFDCLVGQCEYGSAIYAIRGSGSPLTMKCVDESIAITKAKEQFPDSVFQSGDVRVSGVIKDFATQGFIGGRVYAVGYGLYQGRCPNIFDISIDSVGRFDGSVMVDGPVVKTLRLFLRHRSGETKVLMANVLLYPQDHLRLCFEETEKCGMAVRAESDKKICVSLINAHPGYCERYIDLTEVPYKGWERADVLQQVRSDLEQLDSLAMYMGWRHSLDDLSVQLLRQEVAIQELRNLLEYVIYTNSIGAKKHTEYYAYTDEDSIQSFLDEYVARPEWKLLNYIPNVGTGLLVNADLSGFLMSLHRVMMERSVMRWLFTQKYREDVLNYEGDEVMARQMLDCELTGRLFSMMTQSFPNSELLNQVFWLQEATMPYAQHETSGDEMMRNVWGDFLRRKINHPVLQNWLDASLHTLWRRQ